MGKITRVRTGCWTCKERRKKCDEAKPICLNCSKSNRFCKGYKLKLIYDFESDNFNGFKNEVNGIVKYGFIGRPRSKNNIKSIDNSVNNNINNNDTNINNNSIQLVNTFKDNYDNNNNDNNNNENKLNEQNSEETKMLNHFFQKLVPLIDVLPNSPWPDLALKYCDFELAKSCFLSLSYVHKMGYIDFASIIENNSKNNLKNNSIFINNNNNNESNELLVKSTKYINNSLDYIVNFLKEYNLFNQLNDSNIIIVDFQPIINKLKIQFLSSKIFVILLLIFIQILYAILDSGRSALTKLFLKLFASIVKNKDCRKIINKIDQSESIIVLLSYFDIIISLNSPNYRIPYCNSNWIGNKNSIVSIEHRIGLPVELCECIYDLCYLRNDINFNKKISKNDIKLKYFELQLKLNNYRDYVSFDNNNNEEDNLLMRIKIAQLWSLAISIKLLNDTKIIDDYQDKINMKVSEFLDLYSTMDSNLKQIGQMVWPLLEIGIHCNNTKQKLLITKFFKNLYKVVKAVNIKTCLEILEKCWELNCSFDEYLMGKEWLQSGIEFLPL